MSDKPKSNVGHSVFQRLLNHAKENGEDFNLLLSRYGVERLLYRLSISPYSEKFILKGASLFLVWQGKNYRVTRDADLLGYGSPDANRITSIFKELCRISDESVDGVRFMPDTIAVTPIREEHEYDGIRVTLVGMLHQARIPLQVDIGFGDAVTPPAEKIEFPTILDAPAPVIMAYPRYTMVAEKLEAMVRLGIANSRMKDFYDVWLLSSMFEFDGRTICEAVKNTFTRRATKIPEDAPTAFTETFKNDAQKQIQWRAFLRKSNPESFKGSLADIIDDIADFVMPVLEAVSENRFHESVWKDGGPWRNISEKTSSKL
jgi:predicted nucleotidyltransferase component of viral defense system